MDIYLYNKSKTAELTGVSRNNLYNVIDKGLINLYFIPGRKKPYLSINDIENGIKESKIKRYVRK